MVLCDGSLGRCRGGMVLGECQLDGAIGRVSWMVLLEGSVGWCYWRGQFGCAIGRVSWMVLLECQLDGDIGGVSWIVLLEGQLDCAIAFSRMVLGDGSFRWYCVINKLGQWEGTMVWVGGMMGKVS